jgi:hypothetical protein
VTPHTDQRPTGPDLAAARQLVTQAQTLAPLGRANADEVLAAAWGILRDDHLARLQTRARPTPDTPARIYRVPLAVFQAGPYGSRRKPRLIVHPRNPRTPEDAA